jgi:c-di-GMP-binding flagellar brake protein YcgR
MPIEDKRKHPRIKTYNPYVCIDDGGNEIDEGLGTIMDVSLGGILIETVKPIATENILLTITGIDDAMIDMKGKVAYSRAEDSGMFRTGIQFLEFNENIQIFATNLIKIYSMTRKNKMVSGLGVKEMEADKEKAQDSSDPWAAKRASSRKKCNLGCDYRSKTDSQARELYGKVIDISKEGMKLVVKASNSHKYSHVPGDEFFVKINLTPNQELNTTAKIVNIDKSRTAATIRLGMTFTHMNQADQEKLGFFLLA